MKKIFALVDCNSFYCSCERLFQPALKDRPLIVLSNNDGCAVSRTDEAKALGIKMGAPYFQIKDLVKKHKVSVFSSNYTLYGDISRRVMQILAEFAPEMEVYSIDEAFLSFTGMEKINLTEHSLKIRETVLQQTGIPTCVGIGSTKVLAKLANAVAKKNKIQSQGVVNLLDENYKNEILKKFPVEDIWGVGRQTAKKLHLHRIRTAWDLMQSDPEYIRKFLGVVGARIVEELRGVSCLDLETDVEDQKQIISSRSFGKTVSHIEDLQQAVANHISTAAEKLRRQKLICHELTVFIQESPFKNRPCYYNSGSASFLSGTSVTPKLLFQGARIVQRIFKEKCEFKKCGVILGGFSKATAQQTDFFHSYDTLEEEHCMQVLDNINLHFGKNTLKYGACGTDSFWKMLSEMKSPCYTTRWSELCRVK